MSSKAKKSEQPSFTENIFVSTIDDVLSQGFGRYSKYVLQERAVPDVRDGLKPVQRRILYTMYLEGNTSNKPTRKCARTVGQVIGRFHPHGDTSVYEAMVRLSQDWKMRIPLIDFQGNNGSIDGDSAAAYRYTEARLSEISDKLVLDLNKNTVDMELNFDDQELEPVVLPARFPNLLVNGSSGVAVGASTDIPPHNLSEVVKAINYRIKHPDCRIEDLLKFIKGPDFPTGGVILNQSDFLNMYKSGKGLIKLMSKAEVIEDKNINQIIITEIPYGRDKSDLVSSIDKFRFANNLDAIIEVRDETGQDGLRIAIDVKKEADPYNLLRFIKSKGVLSTTIKYNMLVIDHNRPRTLNLAEVIDCYVEHQIDVITRRSKYDLDKMSTRVHIVEGLIKAISILDQVIELIRKSKDKADAKEGLIHKFDFTPEQAEALLMLQLYRLSNTDVTTLIEEAKNLHASIDDLNDLLNNPTRMDNLIIDDLTKIAESYKDPRRTSFEELTSEDTSIDHRALVLKEETVIVFTRNGYFKRCQMRSYNAVSDQLPGIKDGDVIVGSVKCFTTDYLLAFTSLGNYLLIPVYKLFDNKWKEEGKHINEISSLANQEKIVGGFVVSEFIDGINVVMLSKNNQIKRSSLKEFEGTRISKPVRCFKLAQDDEMVAVVSTSGNSDILVLNAAGTGSFFNENEIPKVSLKAGGVKAMNLGKDQAPLAALIAYLPEERSKLMIITDRHGARIVDQSSMVRTIRPGTKQVLFKTFNSDPQSAIYATKWSKNQESKSLSVVLDNNVVVNLNLEELKPQPLGGYLKTNLQLDEKNPLVGVHNFKVDIIDENTKPLTPASVKKVKEVKPQEEDFEQIRLFDFVDDDD